jgi:hypothetical protein
MHAVEAAGGAAVAADDEVVVEDTVVAVEVPAKKGSKTAAKKAAEAASNASDRCPWNWKLAEVICATGASLAASETFGEQEHPQLWERCAVEYEKKAREMATKRTWVPAPNGDPVVEESIYWRCRAVEGGFKGKPIYDRWLETRREITNFILPLLQTHLTTEGALHSGTQWPEVIAKTKASYWKEKRTMAQKKKDKAMSADWNPPAWAVFVLYGPGSPGGGIVALRLTAASRRTGSHDVSAGRDFLRKKAKTENAKAAKADALQEAATGAPQGQSAATASPEPSFSPATKAVLKEMARVSSGVEHHNVRQDILAALSVVTEPSLREALVKQLIGLAVPQPPEDKQPVAPPSAAAAGAAAPAGAAAAADGAAATAGAAVTGSSGSVTLD